MYLKKGYTDRFHYANHIIVDKVHNKGDKHWNFNPKIWGKSGTFDIINDMNEYVTLVQLMYNLGDAIHYYRIQDSL